MPVVILMGTPYERGFAHGSRFRSEITVILDRDLGGLPEQTRSAARQRAVAAFEAIRLLSPEVAEEIEGIAAGCGRGVSDLVLRSGFELLSPTSDVGCSAVCLKTDAGAIVGQNWDGLPSKHRDIALFMHFSKSGFQFAVVAAFGGLGFVGMNNRGLSLVNTDLILSASRQGIPSQVVRRIVLGTSDVKSATAKISALPHIGGRSYLLADRAGDIAAVEVSAKSGANFFASAEVHLHTNNALLPAPMEEEDEQALLGMYPSSAARLLALERALAREPRSVDGVKRALSDEAGAPDAVCKTSSAAEPTETAFSVVMDCARGEMHVAAGKPSINAYRKFSLPIL